MPVVAVAGRPARGDRVVDRPCAASSLTNVSGLPCRTHRRPAPRARHRQVALLVDEVLDSTPSPSTGPSSSFGRVGQARRAAAVVVVLGQVAVGERVRGRSSFWTNGSTPPSGFVVMATRHDRHRLVPRGALASRRCPTTLSTSPFLTADAPVLRRGRHRDVPRHGAGGLAVVRVGAEQPHGAPVARELQVGRTARRGAGARPCRRAWRRGRRSTVARGVGPVRVRRLVGEREAPVRAAALEHVEDRVGACRPRRPSTACGRSCIPLAAGARRRG